MVRQPPFAAPLRLVLPARLPRVSLAHVWLSAALVVAGLGSGLLPVEPIDYWWTVKLGELIWLDGALPTTERLIYTPVREPIIDGQWLAQLLLFAVHTAGGPELALALRMAVALAISVLLIRFCLTDGATVRATAVSVALAMTLVVPGLAIRPQMFAVLPFVLVARAALAPPPGLIGVLGVALVLVFWTNVHGSFVLAYALFGAGLLDAAWDRVRGRGGDRLRRTLRLVAVCALAPLANPYGPGLVSYVVDAVLFNGFGSTIGVLGVEWGSPELRTPYGGAFYGSIVIMMGLLARGHRPRVGEALLLLLFGLLTVQAVRNMVWWAIVMAPYLARALGAVGAELGRWAVAKRTTVGCLDLARATDGTAPRGDTVGGMRLGVPAINAAYLILFVILIGACLPWWRSGLPLPPARTAVLALDTPVLVAEYLAVNRPPGRLFNFTDWGAYFAWRLGPTRPVFIDDRFELHPAEVWRDYSILSRGHVTWEEVAERYGITQLALDLKYQEALVQAARLSPSWALAYQDEQAVVFERLSRGQ